MVQAHIFVSGFVQGVGYRRFVKHQAKKLGITGWVRNIPSNQVEAVLQGEKKTVEKLIEICRRGPFLAEIKELVVEWEEEKEQFSEFSIIW